MTQDLVYDGSSRPSPRSVSTGLFGLAAVAALAAAAAFAGLGPFATQANAVAVTSAPATVAPTAVAAQPLVPRISTGSGTLSFVLNALYTYGADASRPTITAYDCQNSTIPPASGSGPPEPAIGFHGLLGGHQFNGYFTPTRTYIQFNAVRTVPIVRTGPLGTFVGANGDMHVSGTLSFPTEGPDSTGSVTADLTCTTGPTAAPAAVSVVPAPVATTTAPVSSSGLGPWSVGLAVLAIAAAAGGLATRKAPFHRAFRDSHQPDTSGVGQCPHDFDCGHVPPVPVSGGQDQPGQPSPPAGFQPTPPPNNEPVDGEEQNRVPLE